MEKMGMTSPHPRQEQQEHEWRNGFGRERKKGIKGPRKFNPGCSHKLG
jgi:hypothetical protein